MNKLFRRFAAKQPWVRLGLMLIAFSIVGIDPALAVENGTANEAALGLASILSIVIHILTFLVLLIMSWGGDLIGTTFLTGPDAMESIRPMWVFIRNIVNISFVLVLLFLAFANLFSSIAGGQGGNWTIKEKLPRVIIALIAVNFSLLIFRVAIDGIHVGTITILSITDTVMEEKQANNPIEILNSGIDNTTFRRCGPGTEDDRPVDATGTPNEEGGANRCIPFYRYMEHALCPSGNAEDSDCLVAFTDNVRNQNSLVQASSSTEQNIFWAFGTYFQKLELLPLLAGKLNTYTGVVNSTLFSAIMAILYAVAWVAIFVALAIRVIVLWGFMIASPALLAAQIMGVGGGMGDLTQRLVTNLIMPIKIATAFAISFVMIATMIEVAPENHTTMIEAGAAIKAFWATDSGVFSIMWQVMTIVIFWITVWWALKGSEAEFITDKIKGGTVAASKYVGTWALDKARIPIPGGPENLSLGSLRNVGRVFQENERQRGRDGFDAIRQYAGLGGSAEDTQRWRALETSVASSQNGSLRASDLQGNANFNGENIRSATSDRDLARVIERIAETDRRRLGDRIGLRGDDAADAGKIAQKLRTMRAEDIDGALRNARLMSGTGGSNGSNNSNNNNNQNNNQNENNQANINVEVNENNDTIAVGGRNYDASENYSGLIRALRRARSNGYELTQDEAQLVASKVADKSTDDIMSETDPSGNDENN